MSVSRTWTGEWHPVAERFPMLSEEEIRRLADSITETGQIHPCLMTPDGLGLDGRNRVAACKIAGVEPQWDVTKGDPVGVIIAGNVNHRHMTSGQQAMAVAIGMQAQGLRVNGRWKRGSVPDAPGDITESGNSTWRNAVQYCGIILDYRPDLADDVLHGNVALDAAFQQARAEKNRREDHAEKLTQLPADLAALVESGVRDIDSALDEVGDRETVREVDQVRKADATPGPTFGDRASQGVITWREAATLASQWDQERTEAIQRSRERIRQVNSAWGVIRTVVEDAGRAYVKEILEGLGDADREALDEILNQVRGKA